MPGQDARYQNHHHYIREGWAKEPKETFKALAEIIEMRSEPRSHLDVGCATGELLSYARSRFSIDKSVGWDVFEELLETGRRLFPTADFARVSVVDDAVPEGKYDLVTAMGVMSIFSFEQLERFWRNLTAMVEEGGMLVVLSPLNEFGCDIEVTHRKRRDRVAGHWEQGWSVYSFETIREIVEELGWKVTFVPFQIGLDLEPADDPVRTWTVATGDNPRQLTNGLKLLINHYFMVVRRAN